MKRPPQKGCIGMLYMKPEQKASNLSNLRSPLHSFETIRSFHLETFIKMINIEKHSD